MAPAQEWGLQDAGSCAAVHWSVAPLLALTRQPGRALFCEAQLHYLEHASWLAEQCNCAAKHVAVLRLSCRACLRAVKQCLCSAVCKGLFSVQPAALSICIVRHELPALQARHCPAGRWWLMAGRKAPASW